MKHLTLFVALTAVMALGCKKQDAADPAGDDTAAAKPAAAEPAAAEPAAAEPAAAEPAAAVTGAAPSGAAPFAAIVQIKVADFDAWKKVFDANQETRKASSMLGHHLGQMADDPNAVAIYMPLTDVDAFQAFASSEDLKKTMSESGVQGPPSIWMVKPVISEAVLDKGLPAMAVVHEVEDFDKWRAAYVAFAETRKAHGIIGHAVDQFVDNPNKVVVYHQAESADSLKKLMESDDLKKAMGEAGVKGAPEVIFMQGSPAVMY